MPTRQSVRSRSQRIFGAENIDAKYDATALKMTNVGGKRYALPWTTGIVGMIASLVAMVVVTLMTREPDAEMQAMVDETRDPTGPTIIAAH